MDGAGSRRLRRTRRGAALETSGHAVCGDAGVTMAAAAARLGPDIRAIADALAEHGLILRGGFSFTEGEDAPDGPNGAGARSVMLVGQGGASVWPHFSRW